METYVVRTPLEKDPTERKRMAGARVIRVSEGSICAVAAPRDQLCFGTAWSLAAGITELVSPFWIWPGSFAGNESHGSNQSK